MNPPLDEFGIRPAAGQKPTVDPAGLISDLGKLVASAEPAVVFTSFAMITTKLFADECHIFIDEVGVAAYRISWPSHTPPPEYADLHRSGEDHEQRVDAYGVSTRTRVETTAQHPGYRGTVVHRWRQPRDPSGLDAAMARVALAQAEALIREQRLEEEVQMLRRNQVNMEVALASSREIGAALGILMATDRINEEDAFILLRTASQHSHRKLRDIANEVTFTGALNRNLLMVRDRAASRTSPTSHALARSEEGTCGG